MRRPGCRRHNSRRRRQGPHDPDSKASRAPSRRWERANARVRRIHAQVAAIRAHEIHQATTDLATRHEVVAVEQLAAENMSRRGGRRKRGLNRALADAALGRIRKQLDYKATWCGTTLVTAPRYFPSTQLCSHCGAKTKLRLGDRTYRCRNGCPPLDRDLNAAINLARLGDPTRGGTGTGIGSSPPPASRLEMDVEASRRPSPPPRWRRHEAMKRQPRTPLRRGLLLLKAQLPEMPTSQTGTFQLTV